MAAKFVRFVATVFDIIFNQGMRVLGPILICLATTLIATVIYVYFTILLPWWTERQVVSFTGVVNIAMAVVLTSSIFFNYFMCVLTPPGHVPDDLEMEGAQDEEAPARGQGFAKFCRKCDRPKPPRAHHCHVCRRCVLKMDHHCPWIGNCVGHYNYRYFVNFLGWLWAGCLYVCILSFRPFYYAFYRRTMTVGNKTAISFTFMLTASIFVALSALFGGHLYLTLTGQTTIEFYYNRFRKKEAAARGQYYENPYDLGYKRNFEDVFGRGSLWFGWLMLSAAKPLGDGMHWRTIHDEANTYLQRHRQAKPTDPTNNERDTLLDTANSHDSTATASAATSRVSAAKEY
eukprot:GFYU01003099.1.p1 GENE.GFYU01003099.1~~GFYU01003099.1.p1  ORF type:complete len:345 (-),score=53.47 GFYU01003099.1:187-1221(-)